jgi:hypothetical protein
MYRWLRLSHNTTPHLIGYDMAQSQLFIHDLMANGAAEYLHMCAHNIYCKRVWHDWYGNSPNINTWGEFLLVHKHNELNLISHNRICHRKMTNKFDSVLMANVLLESGSETDLGRRNHAICVTKPNTRLTGPCLFLWGRRILVLHSRTHYVTCSCSVLYV